MTTSTFLNRNASIHLLDYANKIRNNRDLCNIIILVDDEIIFGHRLVLSCFSPYFEKIIRLDKTKIVYELEIDAPTMKLLVDYIYCGTITVTSQNVVRLLSGTVCLELEELEQFCLNFLKTKFSADTVVNFPSSKTWCENQVELKDKIKQCISPMLSKVSQTSCFERFSSEELQTCVFNLHSLEINEKLIYEVMVTWTNVDVKVRTVEFWQLFRNINLHLLTVSFIERTVMKEELVLSDPDCETMTLTALSKLVNAISSNPKETHVISFGGYESPKKLFVVLEEIQPPVVEIKPGHLIYPDFPNNIYLNGAVKLDNNVYCISGTPEKILSLSPPQKALNSVRCLNLKQKDAQWKKVRSLIQKRLAVGASTYEGFVAVAGGAGNGKKYLSSTEFYSIDANEWNDGPNLNEPRAAHALISCNGCLYAIGGLNLINGTLSSVDKLEELNGPWKLIQPMQTPRSWLAAVNCNGVVYAICGMSGGENSSALKSVEKYDSDYNRWSYVSDMNISRRGHAACVLRGKIYVVGGKKRNGDIAIEIERYDPVNDNWEVVCDLSDDLCYHSLIAA